MIEKYKSLFIINHMCNMKNQLNKKFYQLCCFIGILFWKHLHVMNDRVILLDRVINLYFVISMKKGQLKESILVCRP